MQLIFFFPFCNGGMLIISSLSNFKQALLVCLFVFQRSKTFHLTVFTICSRYMRSWVNCRNSNKKLNPLSVCVAGGSPVREW